MDLHLLTHGILRKTLIIGAILPILQMENIGKSLAQGSQREPTVQIFLVLYTDYIPICLWKCGSPKQASFH